jgi:nucleotide-binding universal stress UspA family protein
MSPSIVCGIDASTQSQAALQVAAALAERLRLRLVLVHAVAAHARDLPRFARARVRARGEPIDTLRRDTGERLLRRAADSHGLPRAESRLERGEAVERLCAVAHEERAELVVVGSRGHGALRAAIRGSVSTAVVRRAPCPVVVVPPGMAGLPLEGQQIVCAIEGGADRPAVAAAARLSRELTVPLTLSHVLLSPSLPTDRELGTLAFLGTLSPTLGQGVQLRVGHPHDEILKLAASTPAILLVVGSRALGPLEGGLIGSVSRKLVRHATRPVVICRREQSM